MNQGHPMANGIVKVSRYERFVWSMVSTALMALVLISSCSWSFAQTNRVDVTSSGFGDFLMGVSNGGRYYNDSPSNEGVGNVTDNKVGTKYLNFQKTNSGFVIMPSSGTTLLSGLRICTANDHPERDPLTFILYGSNDFKKWDYQLQYGTWTQIATGSTRLDNDPGRFQYGSTVNFSNNTSYKSYKIIFQQFEMLPAPMQCSWRRLSC